MKYDGEEMQTMLVGLNGTTTGREEAALTVLVLEELASGATVTLGEFGANSDVVALISDAVGAALLDVAAGFREHFGLEDRDIPERTN